MILILVDGDPPDDGDDGHSKDGDDDEDEEWDEEEDKVSKRKNSSKPIKAKKPKLISDKAQRFQDFMQIIAGPEDERKTKLRRKGYNKKELQDFEAELGKFFDYFTIHYNYN